jgi:pyruvate,water dikinase
VATRLPWWRRLLLRQMLKAANQECNQREAARSAIVASLDAARRTILAAAQLGVEQGALRQVEDCFLGMPSEAFRVLAGDLPPAGMLARVLEREAIFKAWAQQEAPEYLLIDAVGSPQAPPRPAGREAGDGTLWRGVATGTGAARGRVRVLRHPAERERLLPGEILVAPSTDPGWTPLFLQAAGLIVETGGYMSHGAIVAREFALPAVVNLPGIMGQLRDGDEVEVDGLRGEVRRCTS